MKEPFVCVVCGKRANCVVTLADDVDVCMKCDPLSRCGKNGCIGLMEGDGTPHDQTRTKCDKCGRKGRR